MLLAEITLSQWLLPAILLVLLVVMMIFPMLRNKKAMTQYQEMQNNLKAGDKVQTVGGIIGRIVRIQEKDGVKSVFLETGDKKSKTVFELDINSIAGPIVAVKPANAQADAVKEENVEAKEETESNDLENKDEIMELIEKNAAEKEKKIKKSK